MPVDVAVCDMALEAVFAEECTERGGLPELRELQQQHGRDGAAARTGFDNATLSTVSDGGSRSSSSSSRSGRSSSSRGGGILNSRVVLALKKQLVSLDVARSALQGQLPAHLECPKGGGGFPVQAQTTQPLGLSQPRP